MKNITKILLLIVVIAIYIMAQYKTYIPNDQETKYVEVPIMYEAHVEYQDSGCYPNTGCWTAENIYIKNTDTVGGEFEIILYGSQYKDGQESSPRYIDGGSSIIFTAGAFARSTDKTYPPIPYSIKAPTKNVIR